jgi:hypothetical protein
MRRIVLMLTSLSLAGCGYGASRQAHETQTSMIGMSSADLYRVPGRLLNRQRSTPSPISTLILTHLRITTASPFPYHLVWVVSLSADRARAARRMCV